MTARVLIVAGSDSGGGAGIQADIKTVTALGGYAATAVTALTAQNSLGVDAVHAVPADFVARQMETVLSDIGADCIKTGMLQSAAIVDVVAALIDQWVPGKPLVVDPVMVSTSGDRLVAPDAEAAIANRLLPMATMVTPNIPEAVALTGLAIETVDDMIRAARALLDLGPDAVLLTGGHLEGDEIFDVLANRDGDETFSSPRLATRHTHGTGCTLASAIATGIAQGLPLRDAIVRARAFVHQAILTAPGLGKGHGPLNHGHGIPPFETP